MLNTKSLRLFISSIGFTVVMVSALLMPNNVQNVTATDLLSGGLNRVNVDSVSTPAPVMGEHDADDFVAEAAALPRELRTAIVEDIGITPSEYLARAEAAADASGVLEYLAKEGIEVNGSRLDGTDLVVYVDNRVQASAVSNTGAIAVIGEPDKPSIPKSNIEPVRSISGGESWGYRFPSGGIVRCSLAFSGFNRTTKMNQMLSAGHCYRGAVAEPAKLASPSRPYAFGGSFNLSDTMSSLEANKFGFGNNQDGGLIDLSYGPSNWAPNKSVATWGGGNGAVNSSASLPIKGSVVPVADMPMCKSGGTTGWSCGVIYASENVYTYSSGHKVNAFIATTCVDFGDSGGAAVSGNYAIGVVSAKSGSWSKCEGNRPAGFLSYFYPLKSYYDVDNVEKAPITKDWELFVDLDKPFLHNDMKGSSLMFSGAVTGRLPYATNDHTVQLIINGVTYETKANINGDFTFSLAALGLDVSASYSYVLRGKWGTQYSPASSGVIKPLLEGTVVQGLGTDNIYVYVNSKFYSVAKGSSIYGLLASRLDGHLFSFFISYGYSDDQYYGDYVSYAGSKYIIASEAKQKVMNADNVAGLSFVEISKEIFDKLPMGGELNDPIIIRSYTNESVYAVVKGQKRYMITMQDIYNTIGTNALNIVFARQGTVDAIPSTYALHGPNVLLKTADSHAVYYRDGMNNLIYLSSFTPANDLGAQPIRIISNAEFASYTVRQDVMLDSYVTCGVANYLAVDGKLYRADINSQQPVALEANTCFSLAKGQDLPRFLRASATGAIYYREGSSVHYIPSMEIFNSLIKPGESMFETRIDVINRFEIGATR